MRDDKGGKPDMRVLVVDDHPLLVEAVGNVLRRLNPHLEVVEAFSGEDARSAVEASPDLDLVVMDLGLPGFGGFQLLRVIRECSPQTPVVVLSGNEDIDSIKKSINCGASGFIPKSVSQDIMLSALRLVLSGGMYFPVEVMGLTSATENKKSPIRAFSFSDRQRRKAESSGLSARAIEVLELIVAGYSNKEIAQLLDIAESTVKAHVTTILRSLHAGTRTQVIYIVTQGHLS